MRHWAGMKSVLCLPLLLASYASADEGADRLSIDRAIAALNELPQRPALFTGDAFSEFDRLPNTKTGAFRVLGSQEDPASLAPIDHPMVVISHEPWGEATITFPGASSHPAVEMLNPRIASAVSRFITSDVALTEGTWTYKNDGGTTQTVPLLFVMKKEGDSWKIASLRVLAPR